MNETIFRLSSYIHDGTPEFRSFFYRSKRMLDLKCSKLQLCNWYSHHDKTHQSLVCILKDFAPLKPEDLETSDLKKALIQWNQKIPGDPKFYKMLHEQMKLWQSFENRYVEDFIHSAEGISWLEKRRRLKRAPLFELDIPFKHTKASALKRSLEARALIRANPLLRWEDLKLLGVKNSQAIWQSFPQREKHRAAFLERLSKDLSAE